MYDKVAIVRKIGSGDEGPITEMANAIHEYGNRRDVPVFDHHLGTDLPTGSCNVIFVSLGGDGTLLHTADISTQYGNAGIVGLNFGSLGFLTEDVNTNSSIQLKVFEFLDDVIKQDINKVIPDHRMMLEVIVNDHQFYALNEITLYSHLHNFLKTSVYVNNTLVSKYGGNGVSVTTSTGSTALGLSAGGAIISPNTNVMQIVPLLAHRMANQPVIVSGRDTVTLITETSSRVEELFALADSRRIFQQGYKEDGNNSVTLTITRAPRDAIIWRPRTWNFFGVLSQKMGWK